MESTKLIPNVEGRSGDVIKPYLDAEGRFFAEDFWMVDRLAAMKGASVADYNQMQFMLIGFSSSDPESGRKPLHFFVVGPDDPDKLPNEVMSSPGTPVEFGGPGWEPRGERYYYDVHSPQRVNFQSWLLAGAPKENALGEWATGGLPQAYVEWTWLHPSVRGPSPLDVGKGGGRGRRGGRW